MMRLSRRGQNWAVDLLVGVIIFMSIAIFFYTITQTNLSQETTFQESADPIVDELSQDNQPEGYNATPLPFDGFSISHAEMKDLYASNYSEIKAKLNIQGDFCLTVSENGSLVPFNTSGTNQYSFGEDDGDVLAGYNIRCGK